MSNSREANMNDSLNPFDRVTENPKYPFARIYRSSFWQGIADTYDVIVGNHYRTSFYDEDTHAGVLDILIFPIISQQLMKVAFPTLRYKGEPSKVFEIIKNVRESTTGTSGYVAYEIPGTAPMPIRIAAGFFAFALEVPRAILGGLLTLCSLPIVATVHAVSSYKANKLRNEAKELSVSVDENKKSYTTPSSTKKLGDLLGSRFTLADISVNTKENTYEIDAMGKNEKKFTLPVKTNNTENKSLEAFEQLNVGGRRFR